MKPPYPHWLLHESLLASAEATPEKVALVSETGELTYADFARSAFRLARALQDFGLQRSDRVVIQMENSWPCAVAIFGTLLAGGVFVVVNPQTKADKLRYILADCEAAFLLTERYLQRVFVEAVPGLSALRAVVCAGGVEPEVDAIAFEDLLASGGEEPLDRDVIPLDLAALIYTSGSTGQPKGVMMTHRSMVFTVESLTRYLRLSAGDRILGVLPLAFDYGLYQLLMSVRLGATLLLERSFAFPAQVVERMARLEPTVFPGVPTICATLLAMAAKKPLAFPSVTRVTNTAAAMPPHFLEGLRRMFPNALVFLMYGLTECKRVSYLEPELVGDKPLSVGKAIPGTEAFVLRDDGSPADPGEVGILHVRGPHVMAGYWRQPELTAQMLKDGPLRGERMLCTRDHFRIDEEGFLYFVGRTDDIIKTRGEKVSPVEIENVLYEIPGIREAAVIGIPDEVLGEAVKAFVVTKDGTRLSEADVKRICRERLENFMVPEEVVFVDALPKTATGKIRKQSLAKTSAA